MAIELVKVRALIEVGSMRAGTPPLGYRNHILSFNVDKIRGQVSTFSASLKVHKDEISAGRLDNAEVVIYAGEGSPSNRIFTGILRSANITPFRDDPTFVVLNISGNDVLSRLQGKKYTRRCRSFRGTWVSITGVARSGLRSGKFDPVPGEKSIEFSGSALFKRDNLTSTRSAVALDNIGAAVPTGKQVSPEVILDVIPTGP